MNGTAWVDRASDVIPNALRFPLTWRTVALMLPALGLLALLVGPAEGTTGRDTYDRQLTPTLTGWDDSRLQRGDEPDLAFAQRVTQVVSDAIYHCEPSEPQSLLAWLRPHPEGVLVPEHLRCGFCSQISWILAETLYRGGIESAHVLGLDGHVVTAFSVGTTTYVADADFGVLPFVVEWDNPAQVEQQVRSLFPISDPAHMERVVGIFTDTSTDTEYYTMPELRAMADEQSRTLGLQGPLVGLLVVAGALGLIRRADRSASSQG